MKGYRKKIHTDQYLNVESYHPSPHKVGVIRTLYERNDNIITKPEDQKQELVLVKNTLSVCGFRNWFFKEMRERMDNGKTKQKEDGRKKQKEKSDGQ